MEEHKDEYTINDFLSDLVDKIAKKFNDINKRLEELQKRLDRLEIDMKDLQIEVGREKESLKTRINKDILKNLE